MPARIYFGAGARDPNTNAVVPVQTYRARPNTLSQLFPTVKYYIAWGSYEPGSIISLNELGNVSVPMPSILRARIEPTLTLGLKVLMVDFTSADVKNATFTLNSKNEYDADPSVEQNGIKTSWGLVDGA